MSTVTSLHPSWKVIFIHSENCKDCRRMKEVIHSVVGTNRNIQVLSFDSSTDKAIDVAIEYGISDVPGCWVDPSNIICGKDFDSDKLRTALLNLVEATRDTR